MPESRRRTASDQVGIGANRTRRGRSQGSGILGDLGRVIEAARDEARSPTGQARQITTDSQVLPTQNLGVANPISWTFTITTQQLPSGVLYVDVTSVDADAVQVTGLSGIALVIPIVSDGTYAFPVPSRPPGATLTLGIGAFGATGGLLSASWVQ